MTITELKQYVNSEAKRIIKEQKLNKEKSRIISEISKLDETEETFKSYKFKVKHDKGFTTISTTGSSEEVAKKKIAKSEGCPESAITLMNKKLNEMSTSSELDGTFNKSADSVRRKDKTWSDGNLTYDFNESNEFDRLKCRNCGGTTFEVLHTDDWQTSAKCNNCGMYYIVHSG